MFQGWCQKAEGYNELVYRLKCEQMRCSNFIEISLILAIMFKCYIERIDICIRKKLSDLFDIFTG